MIKIGLCDDENGILNVLKNLVCECLYELKQEAEVITYCSGESILADLDILDMIFLDIEMPGIDGIEIGKILKKKRYAGKLIMATAKIERFKEAFAIDAFRFVTKPFQKEEILQALKDYMETRIGMKEIQVYRERNGYVFCQKDITYVYSINSALELCIKKEIYRMEASLSELEEILDSRLFFRISKQYIVNLQEINDYQNGKITIDGKKLKVSVRKKKEFEKTYMMFDVNYR